MTLLTEAEAKTKLCPMVRYCSNQLSVIHDNDAPLYEQASCIASGCMAWRWEAYRRPEDRGGDRRGYCGDFGIPMESIV